MPVSTIIDGQDDSGEASEDQSEQDQENQDATPAPSPPGNRCQMRWPFLFRHAVHSG